MRSCCGSRSSRLASAAVTRASGSLNSPSASIAGVVEHAQALHAAVQPRRVGRQQHAADRVEHRCIARQPGCGVEARAQRHHTGYRQRAVRGAQSPQAAVARRHARRAAGIGGEREVDQSGGHRGGRAARRAAGHARRRRAVARRAVVHVVAVDAVGQLVGHHLAHQRGAGWPAAAPPTGCAAPAPDAWPARSGCRRRWGGRRRRTGPSPRSAGRAAALAPHRRSRSARAAPTRRRCRRSGTSRERLWLGRGHRAPRGRRSRRACVTHTAPRSRARATCCSARRRWRSRYG